MISVCQLSRTILCHTPFTRLLSKQIQRPSVSKVVKTANEKFKNNGNGIDASNAQKRLNFEEFRNQKVISLEEFSKDPYNLIAYHGNREKINEAYEKFCRGLYSAYQHEGHPHPVRMI